MRKTVEFFLMQTKISGQIGKSLNLLLFCVGHHSEEFGGPIYYSRGVEIRRTYKLPWSSVTKATGLELRRTTANYKLHSTIFD